MELYRLNQLNYVPHNAEKSCAIKYKYAKKRVL